MKYKKIKADSSFGRKPFYVRLVKDEKFFKLEASDGSVTKKEYYNEMYSSLIKMKAKFLSHMGWMGAGEIMGLLRDTEETDIVIMVDPDRFVTSALLNS